MGEPTEISQGSDWIAYYGLVRQAADKFDELSSRMVLQGSTFSAGILAISGVFFSEALKRVPPDRSLFGFALAVGLASIAATMAFAFLAIFYSKLLGAAVGVATNLEGKLIANEELAELRLSGQIDKVKVWGRKFAGVKTYRVFEVFFGSILFLEIIVSFFYSLLFLGVVTP